VIVIGSGQGGNPLAYTGEAAATGVSLDADPLGGAHLRNTVVRPPTYDGGDAQISLGPQRVNVGACTGRGVTRIRPVFVAA